MTQLLGAPNFMLVCTGLILFLLVYFGAAAIAKQQLIPQQLARHPLIHTLSLTSVIGVLGYFGMVEMAERFGSNAILAFMSLIVVFIFAPLFLQPMQWIAYANRFPSIADMLVYRFRGLRFGQLVTTVILVTLLPMAMAQIKAFSLAVEFYLPVADSLWAALLTSLPLIATVLILLWRYGTGKNHHDVISLTMAAGAVLLLLALLAVGVASVYQVFDGFDGMAQWLATTNTSTSDPDFEEGYALIIAFLLASLVMPQTFYLQSKVRFSPGQLNYASWCFPLILLLMTLPMFPLLWAGTALQLENSSQLNLLALANILQTPALGALAFAGGLAAATAGLLVIILSASQMVTNYWLLPAKESLYQTDFYQWYGKQSRTIASLVLLLALGASAITTSSSITDLSLVAMTGISQLAPAFFAAFYFPQINRTGIIWGLIGGISLWAIGLFIPLFTGEWSWTVPWLNTVIPFGPANWHNWLLETTVLNITLMLLVSRFTTTSEEEARHAELCLLDSMPVPQRVELAEHSLAEIRKQLAGELGETLADTEISKALERLNLQESCNQPFAMRLIRDELSADICKLLGVYLTQRVIDRAIPLNSKPDISADDINLLETELGKHSRHLTGLSAELNKLRLHHRNTLNNLPIGACSVGSDGEILLWNRAMEEFTGISASVTQGTLIHTLPSPWNQVLGNFSRSPETQQLAVKIDHQNHHHWCNLFKATIAEDSPELLGSQVLLLEDITDTLLLTRELAHTERLASVGRLAAGVAHEIGNPVTGISCLAQDIRSENYSGDVNTSMEMILTQTERISRIVSSLINFSRSGDQDSEHYSTFPLTKAVNEAIQLLELQTDKKNIGYQNLVPDTLEIQGDLHQITQVFLNLLSNARDASPADSHIEVAARNEDAHIIVTVTDQGPGIEHALLEQIFEPFFTTKQAGDGTGLGLSLVYSIIKKHGGTIRFENLNPGGRMEIKLPLVEKPEDVTP